MRRWLCLSWLLMLGCGPSLVTASAVPTPNFPLPWDVPAAAACLDVNDRMILAVMDLVGPDALEPNLRESITTALRVRLAQASIPVIDGGTQNEVWAEQIREAKSESYELCYDTSCQIPLGKALAASHILRVKLQNMQSRCLLTAELIELEREIMVGGASIDGACHDEGLLTLTGQLARRLTDALAPAEVERLAAH